MVATACSRLFLCAASMKRAVALFSDPRLSHRPPSRRWWHDILASLVFRIERLEGGIEHGTLGRLARLLSRPDLGLPLSRNNLKQVVLRVRQSLEDPTQRAKYPLSALVLKASTRREIASLARA